MWVASSPLVIAGCQLCREWQQKADALEGHPRLIRKLDIQYRELWLGVLQVAKEEAEAAAEAKRASDESQTQATEA